mmetsp:Transcript_55472/g.132567  ORF Transcript_55472/g.132567 Transcript_55472/m.132567 type:complete len:211 (-) Transcript_55472:216-848(-)
MMRRCMWNQIDKIRYSNEFTKWSTATTLRPLELCRARRSKSVPSALLMQMGSMATSAMTQAKLASAEAFSSTETCRLVVTCQVELATCLDGDSFWENHCNHWSSSDSGPFDLRIFARVQKAIPSSSSSTRVKPFSNLFLASLDPTDRVEARPRSGKTDSATLPRLQRRPKTLPRPVMWSLVLVTLEGRKRPSIEPVGCGTGSAERCEATS